MKRILLFIVVVSLLINLYGHSQQKRYYEDGIKLYQNGFYQDAVIYFKNALEQDNPFMELHYWLGKSYLAQQKYDDAYEQFLTFVGYSSSIEADKVREIMRIMKYSHDFSDTLYAEKKHSLGYIPINSEFSEHSPVITRDGRKLYFTVNGRNGDDEIWVVDRYVEKWIKPRPVKWLNTEHNESIGSFSKDLETVYLFGNYYGDSNKGDIFQSEWENGRWTDPIRLASVNSSQTEMQPYVYKDSLMFFTSFRKDGYGGTDIYVSEKIGDAWSRPINLGKIINTGGNEQTPFLDYDGETLFFASDGHYGLGGFDIFMSKKVGDTWQDWAKPINLGVKVNSVRDDRGLFRREGTNEAYLSSNRYEGQGDEDIYSLNMSILNDFQFESPKIRIFGTVKDPSGNPVKAKIYLKYNIDLETFNSIAVSSEKDGSYSIDLDKAEFYNYRIAEEDYFLKKGSILPNNEREFEFNIILTPFETGEVMVFNNIEFEFNSAELLPISYEELDPLAEELLNNPKYAVEIKGHTDSIGSDEYNMKLSEKRAQAVVEYLISKGVSRDKLIAKGYGETIAIDTNETEEGRARNRRVELEILEKSE